MVMDKAACLGQPWGLMVVAPRSRPINLKPDGRIQGSKIRVQGFGCRDLRSRGLGFRADLALLSKNCRTRYT